MKGMVTAAARIAQARASTGRRWRLTQTITGPRRRGGRSGGGPRPGLDRIGQPAWFGGRVGEPARPFQVAVPIGVGQDGRGTDVGLGRGPGADVGLGRWRRLVAPVGRLDAVGQLVGDRIDRSDRGRGRFDHRRQRDLGCTGQAGHRRGRGRCGLVVLVGNDHRGRGRGAEVGRGCLDGAGRGCLGGGGRGGFDGAGREWLDGAGRGAAGERIDRSGGAGAESEASDGSERGGAAAELRRW